MNPLEGKRIRKRYRKDNLYVCPFCDEEGNLIAVDLSQSTGADNHLTVSSLRFISELMEALLKHEGGLLDIACAASVSSLDDGDLPGIVNSTIFPYLEGE